MEKKELYNQFNSTLNNIESIRMVEFKFYFFRHIAYNLIFKSNEPEINIKIKLQSLLITAIAESNRRSKGFARRRGDFISQHGTY